MSGLVTKLTEIFWTVPLYDAQSLKNVALQCLQAYIFFVNTVQNVLMKDATPKTPHESAVFFACLTPFHTGKSSKKRFFRKISFSTREATFQRYSGTLLWTGVTRTPRLKNKENQQPLYHPPLFWRVRQRLFLSDGSRTHNLKWAL